MPLNISPWGPALKIGFSIGITTKNTNNAITILGIELFFGGAHTDANADCDVL